MEVAFHLEPQLQAVDVFLACIGWQDRDANVSGLDVPERHATRVCIHEETGCRDHARLCLPDIFEVGLEIVELVGVSQKSLDRCLSLSAERIADTTRDQQGSELRTKSDDYAA